MKPLFSIIIANYNYGRFLETAIQSVLSQSRQDFELIIIDGGSTDDSVEIIRRYADNEVEKVGGGGERSCRISYWVSEPDKGQSDAFNKGFAQAKGKYLTWLNADDVLMPGALAALAEQIKRHPQCEWFVGSSLYVDKDLHVTKWFRNHRFSSLRACYGFLTCGGPSSFFTKRLLDAVGGIDGSLHFLMDIDLWYKFHRLEHARYVRTTAPVFAYRIHEDSKMSGADVGQSAKALENRRRAQAEHDLICRRHGVPGMRVRRWATLLSFSIIDKVVSMYLTCKKSGEVVFRG